MSWRGLCISSPARLDLRAGRLLLRREGEEDVALPLEDLGFVVIDTPQVRLSAALLSACAEQGCLLLTVDARHMPCAAVLPLAPYYRQLSTLQAQVALGEVRKKRLWQACVRAKIGNQAACLRLLGVALPLILMLMVTKLNDLANACVDVLHVPYRYAFTFTTALRFVPVFGQEMNAIMEAQTARGVEYDTKNPIKKLKLMLPLCVPLLISSVGKTDATALAAEQRGFYLRTRASSYKRYPIKGLDIAVLIVSIALIAIGFLF